MKIAKDKWVTLHYTLTDDDGNQIDSSVGREPLGFPQGYGYLITGLENALEGRDEGEKFSVKIQPEDAYGVYDEALKMDVPRDRFDMDGEIEIGMNFQMFTPQGPAIVRVVEVGDKFIKIDANHELAGKVLNFDVESSTRIIFSWLLMPMYLLKNITANLRTTAHGTLSVTPIRATTTPGSWPIVPQSLFGM